MVLPFKTLLSLALLAASCSAAIVKGNLVDSKPSATSTRQPKRGNPSGFADGARDALDSSLFSEMTDDFDSADSWKKAMRDSDGLPIPRVVYPAPTVEVSYKKHSKRQDTDHLVDDVFYAMEPPREGPADTDVPSGEDQQMLLYQQMKAEFRAIPYKVAPRPPRRALPQRYFQRPVEPQEVDVIHTEEGIEVHPVEETTVEEPAQEPAGPEGPAIKIKMQDNSGLEKRAFFDYNANVPPCEYSEENLSLRDHEQCGFNCGNQKLPCRKHCWIPGVVHQHENGQPRLFPSPGVHHHREDPMNFNPPVFEGKTGKAKVPFSIDSDGSQGSYDYFITPELPYQYWPNAWNPPNDLKPKFFAPQVKASRPDNDKFYAPEVQSLPDDYPDILNFDAPEFKSLQDDLQFDASQGRASKFYAPDVASLPDDYPEDGLYKFDEYELECLQLDDLLADSQVEAPQVDGLQDNSPQVEAPQDETSKSDAPDTESLPHHAPKVQTRQVDPEVEVVDYDGLPDLLKHLAIPGAKVVYYKHQAEEGLKTIPLVPKSLPTSTLISVPESLTFTKVEPSTLVSTLTSVSLATSTTAIPARLALVEVPVSLESTFTQPVSWTTGIVQLTSSTHIPAVIGYVEAAATLTPTLTATLTANTQIGWSTSTVTSISESTATATTKTTSTAEYVESVLVPSGILKRHDQGIRPFSTFITEKKRSNADPTCAGFTD